MNRIKSLALSFTLAAASLVGLGSKAEAQTVPVNPGQTVYSQQQYVDAAYVSQDAINDVAYNVGVERQYYRAGLGYTSAVAQSGENIGLEFTLNGNQATVARAFNLDDPNSAYAFERARDNTAVLESRLAQNELVSRIYVQRYPSYVVCDPIRPILGIGWLLRPHGWQDPFYRDHGRNWDFNNHRPHALPLFPPQHRNYEQPRFEPRFEPRNDHRNDNHGWDNRGWDNRDNRGQQQQRGRDDRGGGNDHHDRNDRGGQQNRGPHR